MNTLSGVEGTNSHYVRPSYLKITKVIHEKSPRKQNFIVGGQFQSKIYIKLNKKLQFLPADAYVIKFKVAILEDSTPLDPRNVTRY